MESEYKYYLLSHWGRGLKGRLERVASHIRTRRSHNTLSLDYNSPLRTISHRPRTALIDPVLLPTAHIDPKFHFSPSHCSQAHQYPHVFKPHCWTTLYWQYPFPQAVLQQLEAVLSGDPVYWGPPRRRIDLPSAAQIQPCISVDGEIGPDRK